MHEWSPGLGPGSGLLSFLRELPDQMKAVLLRMPSVNSSSVKTTPLRSRGISMKRAGDLAAISRAKASLSSSV